MNKTEQARSAQKIRRATRDTKNFNTLFVRLKKILVPYAQYMTVKTDRADEYTLVAPFRKNPAKRFGGVSIRANHVTFYSCPEILQAASPALKQYQNGTASLTFNALNESLAKELEALTATRFKNFQAGSW